MHGPAHAPNQLAGLPAGSLSWHTSHLRHVSPHIGFRWPRYLLLQSEVEVAAGNLGESMHIAEVARQAAKEQNGVWFQTPAACLPADRWPPAFKEYVRFDKLLATTTYYSP